MPQFTRPAPPSLTTPYNFVPLSNKVFFPAWTQDSRQLSHDAPLKEGWCGTLRIRLTAETPLLVAGTQNGAERHPLKVMGKYAIPGSSLRGMLRNVLEIATFGKFGRAVNDRAMFMRNLQLKEYKDHLGIKFDHTLGRSTSKVKMGWLIKSGELKFPYFIYPTKFANKSSPNNKTFNTNSTEFQTGNHGGIRSQYLLEKFDDQKPKLHVTKEVFSNFREAHEFNQNLEKTLADINSNQPTPVFFLQDAQGNVTAMGLTQMFRVPYRHSLHDAIRFSAEAHHDQSRLDFCEALFGLIHDGEDDHPQSLRSRVGFGLALATKAEPDKGVDVVLNEPKPSFYPAYMKGGQTLMSDRPQLAGWKRYPVRGQAAPQNTNVSIKGKTNDNIGSKLFPLKAGATFEGDITLHNLHPEELGGLLWALTWGQQANLRHSLGMGRPFGFGSLKIEVLQLDLRHNSDASQDKNLSYPKDQAAMTEAIRQRIEPFTQTMETAIGQWASSDQVKELQAMANPALGDKAQANNQLRYMPLEDFRLVKGGKGNTAQTLKPFSVLSQPQR